MSTSTVQWNGTGLTTTYTSGTQLTASVPASDIATANSVEVVVAETEPGRCILGVIDGLKTEGSETEADIKLRKNTVHIRGVQETPSEVSRRDPLTRSSRPALREDGTTLCPSADGPRGVNSN